jgi:hypothetical protein
MGSYYDSTTGHTSISRDAIEYHKFPSEAYSYIDAIKNTLKIGNIELTAKYFRLLFDSPFGIGEDHGSKEFGYSRYAIGDYIEHHKELIDMLNNTILDTSLPNNIEMYRFINNKLLWRYNKNHISDYMDDKRVEQIVNDENIEWISIFLNTYEHRAPLLSWSFIIKYAILHNKPNVIIKTYPNHYTDVKKFTLNKELIDLLYSGNCQSLITTLRKEFAFIDVLCVDSSQSINDLSDAPILLYNAVLGAILCDNSDLIQSLLSKVKTIRNDFCARCAHKDISKWVMACWPATDNDNLKYVKILLADYNAKDICHQWFGELLQGSLALNQDDSIDWLLEYMDKHNVIIQDCRNHVKYETIVEWLCGWSMRCQVSYFEHFLKRNRIVINYDVLLQLRECKRGTVTEQLMFVLCHLDEKEARPKFEEDEHPTIILTEVGLTNYLFRYNIPLWCYPYIEIELPPSYCSMSMTEFMRQYKIKQDDLKTILLDLVDVDDLCNLILI